MKDILLKRKNNKIQNYNNNIQTLNINDKNNISNESESVIKNEDIKRQVINEKEINYIPIYQNLKSTGLVQSIPPTPFSIPLPLIQTPSYQISNLGAKRNLLPFPNNNNTDIKSDVILTGRINASKQLEIYLPTVQQWIVPLGEFRCFIADTFYNIGYDAIMPNSFGDEFNVTLAGFKSASVTPTTNYIRDMFISGNTLYLSTRLNIIGSQPYNWDVIDTSNKSVIWTEDSRLNGCYFCGNSASNQFFLVNYNTSYIYWVSGVDLSVLQEYQHKLPILGVGSIDKFSIALPRETSLP